MAEFQELAKAINDNSQCLVQTAQGMSEHNRTMIECTKQIVAEVGSLDLGETENKEKSIGFGQLKVFDGNPKLYENWIKDIEKAAFLNHANDRKKQLLAYQFSTGLVSDYIKRYLESEEHKGWDHLKANLASRFSPVLDGPKAFELLVSLKQNKDEDIQFFAERLLGARHDNRDRYMDRRYNNQPNERGGMNQTSRISCWECNKEGHKRAECPKRLNQIDPSMLKPIRGSINQYQMRNI